MHREEGPPRVRTVNAKFLRGLPLARALIAGLPNGQHSCKALLKKYHPGHRIRGIEAEPNRRYWTAASAFVATLQPPFADEVTQFLAGYRPDPRDLRWFLMQPITAQILVATAAHYSTMQKQQRERCQHSCICMMIATQFYDEMTDSMSAIVCPVRIFDLCMILPVGLPADRGRTSGPR